MGIIRGTAQYIQRWGWWPTKKELARAIRSNLAAVDYYWFECKQLGLMEIHGGKYTGPRVICLSARGWAALSLSPVTPWRKRPSDDKRRMIRDKVKLEVLRDLARMKEQDG